MKRPQYGFTIIELMIATMVFSTVLLLCATGLISVARMYQKGNTSRAAQETARTVMDQIKNDFELTGGNYVKINDTTFCIGANLYSFDTSRKTNPDGTGHALVVSQPTGGCDVNAAVQPENLNTPANPGARELLGPNMRVAELTILSFPSDIKPTSLTVRLNIVAGDADLLNANKNGCQGGPGQEYCAGSILESYVTKRLK